MTETKPKRRWFKFSLRMLLVVVTMLCVWIGIQVNSAHRQKEAVTAILKVGGDLLFDYQSVPPPPGEHVDLAIDNHASPPGPEWLRSRIGEDYFRNVISVAMHGKKITESDLKQIGRLPNLKVVFINNTQIVPEGTPIEAAIQRPIRDADLVAFENLHWVTALTVNDAEINGPGLKSLLTLPRLTTLGLVNSQVEDAGLEHVGKMVNLKSLMLNGAKITDVGLKSLQGLTRLESLALTDTNVSDEGLVHLNSDKVTLLWLRNTHAGDRAMEHIGKITSLETLFLDGTHITDAGLKYLQGLKNLKTLTLGNTAVTDTGLQYLKGLKKLKTLPMSGTKVTREGVRELQKSLPKCEIAGP